MTPQDGLWKEGEVREVNGVAGGGGAILGKHQAHEADRPECGPNPDLEGTRVSEVTSLWTLKDAWAELVTGVHPPFPQQEWESLGLSMTL